MADSRVIQRYVKSLFGLAVERGAIEEVHQDMNLIARVCRQNHDFVNMLRSPIIHHDKKIEILQAIFKKHCTPLSMSMLEMLTRKKREPLLPGIAAYFHTAYNIYKNVGEGILHSAVPLDDTLLSKIDVLVKELSKKSSVDLEKKIDPSLVGGFVLDVGDRRLDASVKHKLKMLEQQFVKINN